MLCFSRTFPTFEICQVWFNIICFLTWVRIVFNLFCYLSAFLWLKTIVPFWNLFLVYKLNLLVFRLSVAYFLQFELEYFFHNFALFFWQARVTLGNHTVKVKLLFNISTHFFGYFDTFGWNSMRWKLRAYVLVWRPGVLFVNFWVRKTSLIRFQLNCDLFWFFAILLGDRR